MLSRCIAAILLALLLALAGCGSGITPVPPTGTAVPGPVIRVSGSGTALPIVERLAEVYRQTHPAARLQFDTGINSGGAIKGVGQGVLELAVVNRPLTEEEARSGLDYRPFARDAVAFAVNESVSIQGLSTAQVRAIYGGEVTDWGQLGGSPGAVIVLDRNPDESMRKLVLLKLLGDRPVGARAVVLTRAGEMVQSLANTPACVGYSSLGLLRLTQPRGVRVLSLDGVAPSGAAVAAGTYPWSLTFGLVRRADAPPAVAGFVAWVAGPEGRRILEAYAYAPPAP